ncbi:MAG: glycosyltransferase family 9 protein [Thermoanaerobaculales bacterium]|nr:glycosyltransferase family 9 protein [Thermoanaerobaculales bacterium]
MMDALRIFRHGYQAGEEFPCRLLVDMPNWLGDLMMALPATDRLVRANSSGSTILHVRPSSARLIAALYPEADVIATPRRQGALRVSRKIVNRGGRADIGVTMRNASRAKIVLRVAARWSAGTRNQGGRILLSWSHRVGGDRHQIHDADSVLRQLGLPIVDAGWRAILPEVLRPIGREALERVGIGNRKGLIGLAPGVAWGGSAKRWPQESFGLLAKRLRARGFSPVVIVGPGEEGLAADVVAASGLDLPVLGTDLDVAGIASVLCLMDAMVGNDSGPAHTAAIFGIPALALFGPTEALRTAPVGHSEAAMTLGLECSPCHRLQCPLGHRNCMRDLDPEAVAERLVGLLEREQQPIRRVVHA